MRYIKIFFILFFLLLVLVFIFQNSTVLATPVELKYGFGDYVLAKAPPLYLLIFAALFLGAFMVGVFDLAIILKNRRMQKKQQKVISDLENELSRFRNQPLSEDTISSPSITVEPGKSE